jgi:hypothetical protein
LRLAVRLKVSTFRGAMLGSEGKVKAPDIEVTGAVAGGE